MVPTTSLTVRGGFWEGRRWSAHGRGVEEAGGHFGTTHHHGSKISAGFGGGGAARIGLSLITLPRLSADDSGLRR